MSEKQQKIDAYITQLKHYNETVNIYSKKAYEHLIFHVQDSQMLATLIQDKKQRVVDFGSGAGLPAAIIAIMNPNNMVVAIESKQRKRRFLHQIKLALSISNLTVFDGDIQQFNHHQNDKIDIITAKAFAKVDKVISTAKKIKHFNGVVYIPISAAQARELETVLTKFIINKDDFQYLKIPVNDI